MAKAPLTARAVRLCRLGLPALLGVLLAAPVAPSWAQEREGGGFFSRILPFSQKPTSRGPANTRSSLYCPTVTVQPGTAAYTLYEGGKEGDPLSVRYQASFSEYARECLDLGAEAGLRIGVVGRAMIGPKGAPGQTTDVPIRFVVLDDKKTVVISRVTRLQVTIPPGQTSVTFTHVEELGSVPMPENRLRNWEFRIGFDSKPTGRPQG